MFSIGLGVIVVTGKVRNKEIAVPDFLITLRCQSSLDRGKARQATDSATYIREWEFVGTVESWENGVASCQQRGKWSLGDTLEVLCPDGRSIPLHPEWIKNEAGESVESTPHAMEKYTIPTPELPPMSLLRRKVETLDK